MRVRRRRLRPTTRHARTRKKGDWIILAHNVCGDNLISPPGCDEFDINSVFAVTLVDKSDIFEKQDALTLVRCVGEVTPIIYAVWTATTINCISITIDEGIYKTSEDSIGGELLLDPRNSADLELDNWMFIRRRHAILNTQGLGPKTEFWSPQDYPESAASHIDLRVARKCTRGEAIVHCMALTIGHIHGSEQPTNMSLQIFYKLRGYVKF